MAVLIGFLPGVRVQAAQSLLHMQPGEAVSDVRFAGLLHADDYTSLGVAVEGSFGLSEIPGEVLILEFFNKGCVPCQRQVRQVQTFYEEIASGPEAGRVRLLAVAAGNDAKYLEAYREKRGLTFPITADPYFDVWRTIGEPGRTPFTVFLRRQGSRWLLAHAEHGVQEAAEILAEALAVLNADSSVAYRTPHHDPRGRPAPAALSGKAQREVAGRVLARVLGFPVHVQLLALPGGQALYRAEGEDGYVLFARRSPVCEICHGVSFALAFDRTGRILGFEAVEVYKWGNAPWTADDASVQQSRLVGRLMSTLSFDEGVDAVSQATISSSLIFDEVRRSAQLLAHLPD